ncbi:unnamed protein product (macronuclear) [Paramecium tetraurelia]|uniref:CSD domain-containing protein n=1 Tax=Paramecium tetraurelia TaxID=5888 RepID=A0BXQ5_PARTE|nr:uncharacterized protein GSPATT00033175001 [Paramecium tetraurelia]CAK63322.1 unnamed protein product [Paramecium tetraurelia]|eukprot:XP_001430720.1 hypothetical protein (macronuclear) [Paramecium tetraurelia strain d4-2]
MEYPVNIQKRINISDQEYNDDYQLLKQNPPGVSLKLNIGTPKIETPSKLPYVAFLLYQYIRQKGRMKFYDDAKKYGFLVLDEDGTDVFVHYDDLQAAGINIEKMKLYKIVHQNNPQYVKFTKNGGPYFEFTLMNYMGKYNKSRKAIDLQLLNQI